MDVGEKYKNNLRKYILIEDIRKKLWTEDGKSRVSIMIGAGFSRNAVKLDISLKSMSLWEDLKKRLVKELGDTSEYAELDVLTLGDIYEEQFGIINLENLLKKEIPDENYEPSSIYSKLLQLPFSDVYTTNYDTLLERASKDVFNRRYQVIYDIHDIPGSVSPRIVKLHGSFPSHRPFVFTKQSYEDYPNESAPFVNMVQQSIMETTMILIGFSGDDPNFRKWLEWVSKTLGKHRPKIYLLGLDIDETNEVFSKFSVTAIDFHSVYQSSLSASRYATFFEELFDFLNINPNVDKRKWPYKEYKLYTFQDKVDINDLIENLTYNRQTYPGWLILPSRIKNRRWMGQIVSEYLPLLNSETEKDLQVNLANEIVWILRTFRIPLKYQMQKMFEKIVEKFDSTENNQHLINLMLFLLREYRLDNNGKCFFEYFQKLKNSKLTGNQKNELEYQSLLWERDSNNEVQFIKQLQDWDIVGQELDYKLKKAALKLEISQIDDALNLITDILQSSRRIQSIDRLNYFALAVEGVSLILLQKYGRTQSSEDYLNRIIELEQNYCNPSITIDYISNLRKAKVPSSIEEKRTFEGRKKVTHNIGNYEEDDLSAAYFLMSVYDEYSIGIDNNSRIDILKYFQKLYPMYSLIKFFSLGRKKEIDDFFSRDQILNLSDTQYNTLFEFLKNAVINNSKENFLIEFDVLYRLYFVLNCNQQRELDLLLLEQYSANETIVKFGLESKNIFAKCFFRVLQLKFGLELCEYVNLVYNLPMIGEKGTSLEEITFDENFTFDPITSIDNINTKYLKNNIISEQYSVCNLLNYLSDFEQPYSVRVGSWQKLIFLYSSENISEIEFAQLKKVVKNLIIRNDTIFNKYLKSFALNAFIKDIEDKEVYMNELLSKNFIESLHPNGFSNGIGLNHQLSELRNLMIDSEFPMSVYENIVYKVNTWWKNQYHLAKEYENTFMRNNDIVDVVLFIKNSIFRLVKKKFFTQAMKDILINCFESLKSDENPLCYFLIPGLIKLEYDCDNLIQQLKIAMLSSNNNIMDNAISVTHDISFLKTNSEIESNVGDLKVMLIQLFAVQKEASLYHVSRTIFLILRDNPSFFTKKELNIITYNVEQFFNLYIDIPEQEVFEKQKFIDIAENYLEIVIELSELNYTVDLEKWINWCSLSNYPEIKKYAFELNELPKN